MYMLYPPVNHVLYENVSLDVQLYSILSSGLDRTPCKLCCSITNPPSTSADSLMLDPSCLHTFYMMCNVAMTSLIYIQFLGVTIEYPPQFNIKLGFSCGCEVPTQTHKSHHQTHESPTQIQEGFHQTKRIIWCQQIFPHP